MTKKSLFVGSLLTLVSLAVATRSHAEALRELSVDNGGITSSPITVDAGHVQIESELVNFSVDRHTQRDELGSYEVQDRSTQVNNVTLKLGLTEAIDGEVGFVSDIEQATLLRGRAVSSAHGPGDAFIRIKINLLDPDGTNGVAVALLPTVKIPVKKDAIGNNAVEGTLAVPISVNINESMSLGLMPQLLILRSADASTYEANGGMSAALSQSFGPGLAWLVELAAYRDLAVRDDVHKVLTLGLSATYANNYGADLGCYFGLADSAPDYNPYVGVSVRL